LSIKKDQQAIQDLNKSILIKPDYAEAYMYRGLLHYDKKRFLQAVDDMSNVIKIKESADAYYYRGAIYYNMKKNKSACSDLQKAAEMGHQKAKSEMAKICL